MVGFGGLAAGSVNLSPSGVTVASPECKFDSFGGCVLGLLSF